jgi:hypothetical protein
MILAKKNLPFRHSDLELYLTINIYRLLQNRISAQRFRMKRKNEYEILKDSMTLLEQENENLKA